MAMPTKKQVLDALWFRGNLMPLFYQKQLELKQFIESSSEKLFVINVHRQFGKSTSNFALCVEYCLRNPNHIVKYGAPTIKQVKEILSIVAPKVLRTCPKHLRPEYNKTDGEFRFKNGAVLKLIGVEVEDGKRLRGSPSNLVILDEAGFIKNLQVIIDEVITPTFLTTNGTLILISTPSTTLGHDFTRLYIPKAKAMGTYWELPITQNPMFSKEKLEEIVKPYHIFGTEGQLLKNGWETESFRREFLCEIFNDPTKTIVPEFEVVREGIVKEYTRPEYYKVLVSADLGWVDHTGVLFGYVDFAEGKLIVEDEIFVNYELPSNIGKQVEARLQALHPGHNKQDIILCADAQLGLIGEIRNQTGLDFRPANKYDRDAAINKMRDMISKSKVIINPKCKNLIQQLETGTWNSRRTDFERTEHMGHLDLLASLMYMIRVTPWHLNPNPPKKINLQNQHTSKTQPTLPNGFDKLRPLTRR